MSNSTEKPVLALDFDGVICSSHREVLISGLEAFIALKPASSFSEDLRRLSAAARTSGEEFENDPLCIKFSPLIPLGNRAEDFGVALLALESGAELPDQKHYDRFFRRQDQEWLARFHLCFYEAREQSRIRNLDRWLALHRPYDDFISLLQRKSGEAVYAIATAKDGVSVRDLLKQFGIVDIFPDDLILDKDTAVKKTKHLKEIASRSGAEFSDITFVDDKVNHLESVADLGVRPALAAWGYNTPREHRRAREQGFEVLTLENAASILFGGLN